MLTTAGMYPLKIEQVKEEAPGCFSYLMRSADGRLPRMLPGQFLPFVVTVNGTTLRRSYSASGFFPDGLFRVTIKKVDNGEVSRFAISQWQPGTIVSALAPAGRFLLPEPGKISGRTFVFIAAGSGITPVFALMQALMDRHPAAPVLLISQFRNEKEIVFGPAIHSWQEKFRGRFTHVSLLSRPTERGRPAQRLNNERLENLLRQQEYAWQEALFYLCGPLSFMRMAAFTLREMGVPENQINRELFDPPREPADWFRLDPAPHEVRIHRNGETVTFSSAFPATMLDAAAKAGLSIPYSCKAGICSACVMRCLSGKVTMRINEVLTDQDIRSGLVLTCVGYPVTDVVLDSLPA